MRRQNVGIFCRSRYNGHNVLDYGADTWLCRRRGRPGNLSFALWTAFPEPTDGDTFCIDTFDDHGHLFHSDKSLFCCCISGSIFGIIFP